jgi:hypothetical protein
MKPALRIRYTGTKRVSPMVLTKADIAELSEKCGRDAQPQLIEWREETFNVKTFGMLKRALLARLKAPA